MNSAAIDSANAREVEDPDIIARSCSNEVENCGVQDGLEILCLEHLPETLEGLETGSFGQSLPPPKTFLRRTRKPEVKSRTKPQIEAPSYVSATTKPFSVSIDDIILETLMDTGNFAHEEPAISCLLRIMCAILKNDLCTEKMNAP